MFKKSFEVKFVFKEIFFKKEKENNGTEINFKAVGSLNDEFFSLTSQLFTLIYPIFTCVDMDPQSSWIRIHYGSGSMTLDFWGPILAMFLMLKLWWTLIPNCSGWERRQGHVWPLHVLSDNCSRRGGRFRNRTILSIRADLIISLQFYWSFCFRFKLKSKSLDNLGNVQVYQYYKCFC